MGSGVLRSECLTVCLSVRCHISRSTAPNCNKFSWRVACGVARSSSGGVAIRHALPVLQITSCLPTIGYAMVGRLFELTHRGQHRPGAESDVYVCLIGNESVPIQLAQCWFSGLAISIANI